MKKKTTDRKSTERKSTRRSRKKSPAVVSKPSNPGRKHELIGLAFLAVGLISICGLFGLNVGFVGVYFAKCLHYLFGVGAILVSLLILLIGYQYIVKHHGLVYSLRFFGMGLLFAGLELPERDAFAVHHYGLASMMVGAALRMMRVDHYDTQSILFAINGEVEDEYLRVAGFGLGDMAGFAPVFDVMVAHHVESHVRMFMN